MGDVPLIRLTVAYDGTRYVGWQRQARGETVQGCLEAALSAFAADGDPVHIHGAGRTDAGVHALGQVAHLQHALRVPVDRLPYALNTRLPADIVVRDAAVAPPGFHARYSATGKHYRYRLRLHRFPDPLERTHEWRCDPGLDVAAMQAAATALCGSHDFTSFTTHAFEAPDDRVRTLRRAALHRDGDRLTCDFEGSGFLRNMVRAIVGTLVDVGQGRRAPATMADLLAARDRRLAGPTAPAHGLCLLAVTYGDVAPA